MCGRGYQAILQTGQSPDHVCGGETQPIKMFENDCSSNFLRFVWRIGNNSDDKTWIFHHKHVTSNRKKNLCNEQHNLAPSS
jgi:hypothetical protein